GVIRNAPLDMRLRADNVWGMLAFVFNGLVFIMLGLQLPDIWETSVAQAELDPNVETWMLFTAVGVIYAALVLLRFSWLWLMKNTSKMLIKQKP
ncbi:Na+/H+ antiporter, partial [Enterobacter hormaechei]|nr:Na+/H+ antiporter [Enterobacter hormaechei]